MCKVLFRPNDHPLFTPVDSEFDFKGTTYSAKIEIVAMPALCSIPCLCCGKNTRQMLAAFDIEVPDDDMAVDVLELLVNAVEHSTDEPEHVFVITKATLLELEDKSGIMEIPDLAEIRSEIEKHIEAKLKEHIVCNACFFNQNHLNSLLEG